jgi:hypothetical protein
MWEIYTPNNDGIMLVSDVKSLRKSLAPIKCEYRKMVQVNYYNDPLEVTGNMRFNLNQFLNKECCYSYENEIRIILDKI